MRKISILLLVTLAAGLTAFGACYWLSVAPVRSLMYREEPGLNWLRSEYHLDDAQFALVSRLHRDYAPKCAQMCDRVAAQREVILKLTRSGGAGVSPELATALRDMAALETECRSAMFTHVYTVAAVMNPADGHRYLEAMTREIAASSSAPAARP